MNEHIDPIALIEPTVAKTSLGPVEYACWGEGPVVIALHGAMGGWEQSAILALTVGTEGFRYLAVSRPGPRAVTDRRDGRSENAEKRRCSRSKRADGAQMENTRTWKRLPTRGPPALRAGCTVRIAPGRPLRRP